MINIRRIIFKKAVFPKFGHKSTDHPVDAQLLISVISPKNNTNHPE